MPEYYLDIETTGLNPDVDKIITIQYQRIDARTGKIAGELVILKEWESDEKTILQKFIKDSGITGEDRWAFIPVGFNLGFEHKFFLTRTLKNNLPQVDILSKPFIDLFSLGVIMNNCQFKGASLENISTKKGSGKDIPVWYHEKKHKEIVAYIQDETRGFQDLFSWLCPKLPPLLMEYKKIRGIKN